MRVAVVGCGAVARNHFVALSRLPDVELVAACDLEPAKADEVAREYGVPRTYTALGDLFEHERPDAVHVLTPPAAHKDVSIAALEAGCHVLVEKPMALDVEEAGEMIEVARRCARTLGVCHNFLFAPPVLGARELLADGALGTVVAVEVFWRVWRGGPSDRDARAPWLRELRGGFLHESAPHWVYLQQAFLGPVRPIAAVSRGVDDGPIPGGELRTLFAGRDGIGTAHVSFGASPYQVTLRIYGTEMTALADVPNVVLVTDPGGERPTPALPDVEPWRRGHAILIERYYASLREGTPPPVTAEEGRNVVALLDDLWPMLEASADGPGA